MRKKKVLKQIEDSIRLHRANHHALRVPFGKGRVATNVHLNEIVLQLMDHLGLVLDENKGELIPKSAMNCDNQKPVGKLVATVIYAGTIHLASKDADPKLTEIRPASDITCQRCQEAVKEKGYLK